MKIFKTIALIAALSMPAVASANIITHCGKNIIASTLDITSDIFKLGMMIPLASKICPAVFDLLDQVVVGKLINQTTYPIDLTSSQSVIKFITSRISYIATFGALSFLTKKLANYIRPTENKKK